LKRIYVLLGLFVVVLAACPFRGVIRDRVNKEVYEQQEGYKTVDETNKVPCTFSWLHLA